MCYLTSCVSSFVLYNQLYTLFCAIYVAEGLPFFFVHSGFAKLVSFMFSYLLLLQLVSATPLFRFLPILLHRRAPSNSYVA